MGNLATLPKYPISDPLLVEYRNVELHEVQDSFKILQVDLNGKNTIDASEFEQLFGHWIPDTLPHFAMWACLQDRIDTSEVFCGATVYCLGRLRDKIDFVFDTFDFDNSKSISKDELVMLINSAINGMCKLAGIPCTITMADVVSLRDSIFVQMDEDDDKSITKHEFSEWVFNDESVMKYIETYTTGTDIKRSLEEFRTRKASTELQFEISEDSSQSVTLETAIDILALNTSVSESEMKQLNKLFADDEDRVDIRDFRSMASGLIAFDIVDKQHDNELETAEMRSLFWLIEGVEPFKTRLEMEMQQIDTDKSGTVSRLEWMKYIHVPDRFFADNLKQQFDACDSDHSGTLRVNELRLMVSHFFCSYCPEKISENGRATLESFSLGMTEELMSLLDADMDKNISWIEVKEHLPLACRRLHEVLMWVHEYETNHVAQLLHFDVDGNNTIDESEVRDCFMESLRFLVDSGRVRRSKARKLAVQYAEKAMRAIDQDASGELDMTELNSNIHRLVEMQQEMLRAAKKTKDKTLRKKGKKKKNKSKSSARPRN
eukprot:191605_1